MICEYCGKELDLSEFWTFKDGHPDSICKNCRKEAIDDNRPETFLPLMKMFDIPYIEEEWKNLVKRQKETVFGRYLNKMKLFGFKMYTFKDTDYLNSVRKAKAKYWESLQEEEENESMDKNMNSDDKILQNFVSHLYKEDTSTGSVQSQPYWIYPWYEWDPSIQTPPVEPPATINAPIWVTAVPEISQDQAPAVDHPSHYNSGKIEVIDYIEDQNLGFSLGNAVKYISRAGKKNKDKEVEDLEKAIWYINRRIKEIKEAAGQE